jgi:hypothetical protein
MDHGSYRIMIIAVHASRHNGPIASNERQGSQSNVARTLIDDSDD